MGLPDRYRDSLKSLTKSPDRESLLNHQRKNDLSFPVLRAADEKRASGGEARFGVHELPLFVEKLEAEEVAAAGFLGGGATGFRLDPKALRRGEAQFGAVFDFVRGAADDFKLVVAKNALQLGQAIAQFLRRFMGEEALVARTTAVQILSSAGAEARRLRARTKRSADRSSIGYLSG